MDNYVCPEGHPVREPGRMGRSWCPVCDSYEVAQEVEQEQEDAY